MTGKTNDSTAPLELIVLTPHGEAVDVHCDSVHLTVCDDETGHGGGQVGFHRGHLPAVLALGDGPAVYYTMPGWKGDIGFIAAVHGKFCASCNRVRLTSQGFLRPCLASEAGCDLKALLRSGAADEELLTAIRTTIWEKPQEHHFELKQDIPATRGMYRIGG